MGKSSFFENLKPWSQRKHRLLGKYLPPFSAKVATTTHKREIFVVDGFAGAALYQDDSEGSPVLIAKFSDICLNWKNPVLLRLINIEPDMKDVGIFASLENATTEWVRKGSVINIRKDFRSAVPDILKLVGDAPTLFFIDPFGPTYVHFDDLGPILSRPQRITELIVNFDQDGLRRIVNAALSENTNPKAAQTNSDNITKVIGSEYWKNEIVGASLSSAQAETVLVTQYMNNLAKFGYDVVAYPIREVLDAKPKYYFVYCTRHQDGIALMNDFIREEEDMLYGDHVKENLPLFSEEASLANAIADRRRSLHAILEKYLEKSSPATRGQIRSHLLGHNFGVFHTKDYNAVIGEILLTGRLKEVSGKKRVNDDDILHYISGN